MGPQGSSPLSSQSLGSVLTPEALFQTILCFSGMILSAFCSSLDHLPIHIKFYSRHLVCLGHGFSYYGSVLWCGCFGRKDHFSSGILYILRPHQPGLHFEPWPSCTCPALEDVSQPCTAIPFRVQLGGIAIINDGRVSCSTQEGGEKWLPALG